ncbi:MAG: major facilitator superfamily 1 [Bryobacterales bacterium]|nr:major facilitator superfamily 1 [Bryobacterales bacterium]
MTRAQWILLALLVASIFLNYIDRSNVSLAAPLIQKEFSLSPAALGRLFSAFFWTYALMQLFGISGWLADRFPVRYVLGGALLVWSAATVGAGLLTGFTSLFAMRLLVGAGESLAYPCYSRIFATDIPLEARGRANALLDAASKLGPAVGTLLGGLLLVRMGWRMFFVVLGIVSIAWLVPWFVLTPKHQAMAANGPIVSPGTLQILTTRSAWGAFLGHFCGNYFWFFLLTWLPDYLVSGRGFSMQQMVRISSGAYFAMAGATLLAGWISDAWIVRGGSPTRVRKTVVVFGLVASTLVLPVAIIQDQRISLGLLLMACLGFGAYTSNHWAITQTLAGPMAAARWTSLQNGIGNLSGIAASWITGVAVERSHSHASAFVIAALVALTGAAMWGLVVGPVRQVRWAGEEVA